MKKIKYGISKFIVSVQSGSFHYRYMITKDFIPLLETNQYLEQKSVRSSKTGKQYAKKLVVYLNWPDQKDLTYEEAINKHVKEFIHELIFGYISVADQSL